MNVLIVGAGQVGQTVARELAPDHTVGAIDTRYGALEQVPAAARVVQGDGVQLDVLQEGNVSEADVLIACTNDDRTNILICSTAKLAANPFTFARVAHRQFLETWHASPGFNRPRRRPSTSAFLPAAESRWPSST